MARLWTPRALRVAPFMNPAIRPGPPAARHALLINPFYPKDPHASFGKHVLTPTLALVTIVPGYDLAFASGRPVLAR